MLRDCRRHFSFLSFVHLANLIGREVRSFPLLFRRVMECQRDACRRRLTSTWANETWLALLCFFFALIQTTFPESSQSFSSPFWRPVRYTASAARLSISLTCQIGNKKSPGLISADAGDGTPPPWWRSAPPWRRGEAFGGRQHGPILPAGTERRKQTGLINPRPSYLSILLCNTKYLYW